MVVLSALNQFSSALPFEAAAAVLTASGLTAEKSVDYAVGTVCRQRVEAGSPVNKGSVVTVYVNDASIDL